MNVANWKVFAVLGFFGFMILGWLRFEYAKTAGGYDFWFVVGVGGAVVCFVGALIGMVIQNKKK